MLAMTDSGVQATTNSAAVTVISAADTAGHNTLYIQNNGSNNGLVSIDGGTTWIGFGLGGNSYFFGANRIAGVMIKNDVAASNLSAVRMNTWSTLAWH